MITIQKILCPIDFFPASEGAADYAAGIAANYGAELKLLHVISPILSTYRFPLNPAVTVKAARQSSARKLKHQQEKARARSVVATTEIRVGNPLREIKQCINDDRPDLVVVGTHGRHGIERWFLGSVTEGLLRHTPVPILTVSSSSEVGNGHLRSILVTTDFSDGTPDALKYAFSIAQENQAKIELLHVVDDIGIDMSKRYRGPFLKDVQKQLDSLVPEQAKDWCEVSTKIDAGTPYRVILETAARQKPDLIVMNIHGKNMLDRALLGSTAERVVRAANCPVMLIPPMIRGGEIPADVSAKRVANELAI